MLMIMNSNKEDIRGNEEARFIVSFIAEKSICHCCVCLMNSFSGFGELDSKMLKMMLEHKGEEHGGVNMYLNSTFRCPDHT